jgi:hypothetical protein
MSPHSLRRPGIVLALALALSPFLLAADPPRDKEAKLQTFTGKVVPLADLLGKFGAKLDADAAPAWLALVADDGKVYPLIKDDASRLFWKDAQLLNRPMRITGLLYPNSQLLQVIEVHSLVKEQLHEVYYWCEICAIRRSEKKICDCCGQLMEFREEPLKK